MHTIFGINLDQAITNFKSSPSHFKKSSFVAKAVTEVGAVKKMKLVAHRISLTEAYPSPPARVAIYTARLLSVTPRTDQSQKKYLMVSQRLRWW